MLSDLWETGTFRRCRHVLPLRSYPSRNPAHIEFQTRGDVMDTHRAKTKVDSAVGRAKRKVEKWTDETKIQVEDAAEKVKGKVEQVWDKMKHAAQDAKDKVTG